MSLFQKKPLWRRATQPLVKKSGGAARAGLGAVGTVVGMTVVSAVLSAVRERRGE